MIPNHGGIVSTETTLAHRLGTFSEGIESIMSDISDRRTHGR